MIQKTIALWCMISSSLSLYAHPGIGIVQDSKGSIYYTDLKQVIRIDPAGRKSVVVQNVHTHELYMDTQDNLYGEHLWYNEGDNSWGHYVWKLKPGGQIEKVIPETKGFLTDYSFARDKQGRMYWASRENSCQKIVRSSPGRGKEVIGDKCLHNIRWMKSTPKGELLFVDFQDIGKIDERGHIETLASKVADPALTQSTSDNQNSVMGVWDDESGNLYVAVYSKRLVKKFSQSGSELPPIKINFPWAPSGGMVDSQGNLWVLESNIINGVRVERIDKQGRRKVY